MRYCNLHYDTSNISREVSLELKVTVELCCIGASKERSVRLGESIQVVARARLASSCGHGYRNKAHVVGSLSICIWKEDSREITTRMTRKWSGAKFGRSDFAPEISERRRFSEVG